MFKFHIKNVTRTSIRKDTTRVYFLNQDLNPHIRGISR